MRWYVIDSQYVSYLKRFDKKVQDINYINSFKPYIGIVLTINNFNYFVPVSSPKIKHIKMRNTIDFFKIKDKKDKIIGVLNINNMIPIPDICLKKLDYTDIDKYKVFSTELEKNKFIKLLQIELNIIKENKNKIQLSALKLYKVVTNNLDENFIEKSCNFKLLEEKSIEFKNNN